MNHKRRSTDKQEDTDADKNMNTLLKAQDKARNELLLIGAVLIILISAFTYYIGVS